MVFDNFATSSDPVGNLATGRARLVATPYPDLSMRGDRIILRLLHILKDEKAGGNDQLCPPVLIVIMMAVAILIFLAGSTFVAVNNTAQHALEMMRIKGKLTPEIERSFSRNWNRQESTPIT